MSGLPTRSACSFAKPSSTIAPSRRRGSPAAGREVVRGRGRRCVAGSTPLTPSWWPKTSAPSWRTLLTVPTPATACSIFGSIGDQPSAAVTIVDACTWRSSAPRLWSSSPWATTVTAVTSATPIISALAVTAVRPGLRIALRRARRAGGAADRGRRAADDAGHGAHAAGEQPRLDLRGGIAQRGHRRDLGRAPGRDRGRDQRGQRADGERDDDRAGGEHQPVGRQVHADRREHRFSPAASATPTPIPAPDASSPIDQRLEQHAGADLAAAGADHPQQPELLRALRDGDRERVEDRERPDDDRHAGEREQDHAQDVHERLQRVEVEAVVVGRRADLGARPRRRAMSARRAATRMRS